VGLIFIGEKMKHSDMFGLLLDSAAYLEDTAGCLINDELNESKKNSMILAAKNIRDACTKLWTSTNQEPEAYQNIDIPTEIVPAQEWENIDPMWRFMYRPLYVSCPNQESVWFQQFLSDVVTAAGLVRHGKQSKDLSERLGESASRCLVSSPYRKPLSDELLDEMESEIFIAGGDSMDVLRAVTRETLYGPSTKMNERERLEELTEATLGAHEASQRFCKKKLAADQEYDTIKNLSESQNKG
jgi:hypothetical protein